MQFGGTHASGEVIFVLSVVHLCLLHYMITTTATTATKYCIKLNIHTNCLRRRITYFTCSNGNGDLTAIITLTDDINVTSFYIARNICYDENWFDLGII